MLALLPIGRSVPHQVVRDGRPVITYSMDFQNFNSDVLVREAFRALIDQQRLPTGSTPGGVILSAHSGGGLDVTSSVTSTTRPPSRFLWVFAFRRNNGDLDTNKSFIKEEVKKERS